MEEFSRGPLRQEPPSGRMHFVVGNRRFRVIEAGQDSCLIEASETAALRGYGDLYDGDRHIAHCLIVLAAPEGGYLRCTFKRRTIPRDAPPRDFA